MVILRHDLPKGNERENVAEKAGAGTTFGRTAGDGIRLPLLISSSLHSHANRVAEHSQKEVKDMRKTELRELYKMMFPDYPDIVTVAQLQKMLGISRHLAYDLINDGYISGIKIGNAFKIPKVNVINYVMEEGGEKNAG